MYQNLNNLFIVFNGVEALFNGIEGLQLYNFVVVFFPKFNLMFCEQVDVSRRVTLEGLPKVLILHLKRFIYSKNGSQKLTKVIDYPLELTIGKGKCYS